LRIIERKCAKIEEEDKKNLEIIKLGDLIVIRGSYPINFNCLLDFG
jgi:hypothetical protein